MCFVEFLFVSIERILSGLGSVFPVVWKYITTSLFSWSGIDPGPSSSIPGIRGKEGHLAADFFCGTITSNMAGDAPRDISDLIAAWSSGDDEALGGLVSLLYPELRRIARQHLGRRGAGQSLESASVANQAYLKLMRAGAIRCENRAHFLALCSQIIRGILVDHANRRRCAKRGGDRVRVPLDDAVLGAQARGVDLLPLNEALEALFKIDARKGRVVELRYFGGLAVEETAEAMGISPETVKRDWKMAKAWLLAALTGDDYTSAPKDTIGRKAKDSGAAIASGNAEAKKSEPVLSPDRRIRGGRWGRSG
jgi:RNA polymerase sigma factor (TIGR02999 family)